MQKQCHILQPKPVRAGHKGIIPKGIGYFLKNKIKKQAIFVEEASPGDIKW